MGVRGRAMHVPLPGAPPQSWRCLSRNSVYPRHEIPGTYQPGKDTLKPGSGEQAEGKCGRSAYASKDGRRPLAPTLDTWDP